MYLIFKIFNYSEKILNFIRKKNLKLNYETIILEEY